MYSVILSNPASKDLTGIVEYIAADNPDAAERTGFELINLAMSLDSMPYRGSKVKKRLGVLKLVHGKYLIYYRVNERKRTVEILSFKHGSRIE
jgi:plasmid stabilization system protein ParE